MRSRANAALRLVESRTRLMPVPGFPAIRIHAAHSGSGLGRLAGGRAAPYWAFAWAGGLALASHIAEHPDLVAGRRVLDLGAGSGLVAIAAARAGAAAVTASDCDPLAAAAIGLNAAANRVAVTIVDGDPTAGPPPPADIILAGDVFYEAGVARRMGVFLERCAAAGIAVLIGDPGRAHLPVDRLHRLAEYRVADMGEGIERLAAVYAFGVR